MTTRTQRDILHVVPRVLEGSVTAREISDMLGIERTYVYKVIRKLVDSGCLIETGYHGDQVRKYSLTFMGETTYLDYLR